MFRKIKRQFISAMVFMLVLILLSIIAAFVSFMRGDIFYGGLTLVVFIAFTVLVFWSKNRLSPFYQMIKEYEKIEEKSLNITPEELIELDDEDLVLAMDIRIQKEKAYETIDENLDMLNKEKKVFYIVTSFKNEVENGGLFQFFTNSSRILAPFISKNLNIIGAENYRKLYENFIKENLIDLSDLSSFEIEDEKALESQYKRYEYDKFDERFEQLCKKEPLDSFLAKYVRENIGQFMKK